MWNLNFSLQNILDGQGIEIAITGMLVVFAALTLIYSFIVLLPIILDAVASIYPPKDEPPAASGGGLLQQKARFWQPSASFCTLG